jgi:hypothetical protein
MNDHVRIGRIVVPLHRMPAGSAGLIADDGRRRAVAFNRYWRCASRRARRGGLSTSRRCSCERGNRCRQQRSYQKALIENSLRWTVPRQRDVSAFCSGPLDRFRFFAPGPKSPPRTPERRGEKSGFADFKRNIGPRNALHHAGTPDMRKPKCRSVTGTAASVAASERMVLEHPICKAQPRTKLLISLRY